MKKFILVSVLSFFSITIAFAQSEDLSQYGRTATDQYSAKAYELFAQSQNEKALNYANKAVAADTTNAYAYYVRSMIYADGEKDYASGLKDIKKAISLNSERPDPAYYLLSGDIKRNLNDFKAAIVDYEQVMKLLEAANDTEYNATYALSFSGRGIARFNLGDKKAACADLMKGKELGDYSGEENVKQYCQ